MKATAPLFAVVLTLITASPSAAEEFKSPTLVPVNYAWSGWEDLGGTVAGSGPSCVAPAVNRLECFARGANGSLYRKAWNGQSWLAWEEAPGAQLASAPMSSPSCILRPGGQISCFVRATDNAMHHRGWTNGQAAPWEALRGSLASDPSCTATPNGIVFCAARGTNGMLQSRSFANGAWQPQWGGAPLAVTAGTRPACAIFACLINAQSGGGLLAIQLSPTQIVPAGGEIPSLPYAPHHAASAKCYDAFDKAPYVVCVAPIVSGNGTRSLGSWTWGPGHPWLFKDLQSDFGTATDRRQYGEIAGYDFDCIVISAAEFHCVELVSRARTRTREFPQPAATTFMRHQAWINAQGSGWQHVPIALPRSFHTMVLDCVSWAADRIDCFAAASATATSPLYHAWRALPPEPGNYRRPRPQ